MSAGSAPARRTASRTTVAAGPAGQPAAITADGGPGGGQHEDFWTIVHVVSSHVQAAVDGPYLSGDVGGLVGGQETHHAGNLLGPSEPADGNLHVDSREYRGGNGGHHGRRDESGGYRVQGQAVAGAYGPLGAVQLEDGLPG